jgi:hypothetical protein
VDLHRARERPVQANQLRVAHDPTTVFGPGGPGQPLSAGLLARGRARRSA